MQPSPAGAGNPFSDQPPDVPRRGFLTKAAAVVIGGIVSFVPLLAGLATFLNPLRPSVRAKLRPTGSDADGYFKVASIDSLSATVPQMFKIIADKKDAWNVYLQEPIGTVYLLKVGSNQVRAFNASCPHANCNVDFRSDKKAYLCPCHNSVFALDGKRDAASPSARDLDSLDFKVENGAVLVKFENFKAGTHEKIPKA